MMSSFPLVIPAAGLGSRLFPATWGIPKELFPLGRKPALHYILEEARLAGISRVLCITSLRKESLQTYLSYRREKGQEIGMTLEEQARLEELDTLNKNFSYTFQVQEEAKGVGNALVKGCGEIDTPYFCMAYPDDILHDQSVGLKSMMDIHKEHRCSVIAVERVPREKISSYGIVACSSWSSGGIGCMQKVVEKPSRDQAPSEFGVVGRYILSKRILDILREDSSERPCFVGAINRAIEEGEPFKAMVLQTKRYDIGTEQGWVQTITALHAQTSLAPLVAPVQESSISVM